jgi:SAM-dependent methyltransferase
MRAAGYEAIGFEISRIRAEFGRAHLGLTIVTDIESLDRCRGTFDLIFASHVLEHLPSPTGIFERFAMLLRRGGSLLAFVPNCGGRSARELGVKWGPMCCEKHPLALDSAFFHYALPKYGFSVRTMSDPYNPDDLMRPNAPVDEDAELSGDELMVWAKKSA